MLLPCMLLGEVPKGGDARGSCEGSGDEQEVGEEASRPRADGLSRENSGIFSVGRGGLCAKEGGKGVLGVAVA